MSDFDEFEVRTRHIRAVAEEFLTFYFGQCEEFEPDCECCKRWKALETLCKNPFDPEE